MNDLLVLPKWNMDSLILCSHQYYFSDLRFDVNNKVVSDAYVSSWVSSRSRKWFDLSVSNTLSVFNGNFRSLNGFLSELSPFVYNKFVLKDEFIFSKVFPLKNSSVKAFLSIPVLRVSPSLVSFLEQESDLLNIFSFRKVVDSSISTAVFNDINLSRFSVKYYTVLPKNLRLSDEYSARFIVDFDFLADCNGRDGFKFNNILKVKGKDVYLLFTNNGSKIKCSSFIPTIPDKSIDNSKSESYYLARKKEFIVLLKSMFESINSSSDSFDDYLDSKVKQLIVECDCGLTKDIVDKRSDEINRLRK